MKIALENISKRYGSHQALQDLNLSLPAAKSLTLIGPSGGGKSTTLRLLAGLELPDSGSITLNDQRIPKDESVLRKYRKSVGVVFQSYNLFPHLDALSNISLPLEKVHGFPKEKAIARAQELLKRLQLAEHETKMPSQLSGGQNQRVAIARSLAHEPDLILFDEPTSALDPEMSAEVLDVIEELIRSGKDCIVVTHQMGFAKRVSDTVAFVANGKIQESGSTEQVFENPQSPELARFIERELRY